MDFGRETPKEDTGAFYFMKLLLQHNPINLKIRDEYDRNILLLQRKLEVVEAISDHVIMLRKLHYMQYDIQFKQFGLFPFSHE